MNGKTTYLAGPMTGHPDNNFPAFDAARDRLVAQGYEVISPADLDRKCGWLNCSREYAARDVAVILKECHGIYLLTGWEHSRGAAAEFFLARWIAKDEPDFEFICQSGGDPLTNFVRCNPGIPSIL